MSFPKTPEEFKAAGYQYESASNCKLCGQPIIWYITPNKRRMPLNPDNYAPHFGSCKLWRKKNGPIS